jgi:hypothetical protein
VDAFVAVTTCAGAANETVPWTAVNGFSAARASRSSSSNWASLGRSASVQPRISVGELRRGIPLISPSLLAQRLKSLERDGLIDVDGPRDLVRAFPTWIGVSLYAIVREPALARQRANCQHMPRLRHAWSAA